MTRTVRQLVAASLVTTALLSLYSNLTSPDFTGDHADTLASIADGGTPVALSGLAFVLAQLPFVVGMAGLARWLQPSRLATVGGVLAVLGGFGHSVYGGVILAQVVMASDDADRAVHAELLAQVENAPVFIPFLAMGLLGTVLGILLLSIAWWRTRSEPRWVAVGLWAFLVVEFVGSGLSEWAAYLSGLLYAGVLVAAAARVAQPGTRTQDARGRRPEPDHAA